MEKQMNLFEEGGLEQDGGTVDPISGNDVPMGSSQEEVRDDIPAQLSEGEFVFPADVVRFIGLEKLMMMRQEAKAGLKRMEDMGQMGNSEEATIPDDIPFDINDLELEDDSIPAYKGGAIQSFETGGMSVTDDRVVKGQDFSRPDDYRVGMPRLPIVGLPPVRDEGYKPPTIEDTPVREPTDPIPPFDVFVPPVADEYREYVNDEGIIINVPYFRGNILPGYSLPQGYTLKEEESVVPEQEGILTDITQEPERDREREIQVAEEEKKMRDRSYSNVVKQIMDENPGLTYDEIKNKIKGGESTIDLFGKKIKAPGFLFDEKLIEDAYNRNLTGRDYQDELDTDYGDDSDKNRGTAFDANFKAKQEAEAQAKAEAEAAAYQESRLIAKQKAEEEFDKKVKIKEDAIKEAQKRSTIETVEKQETKRKEQQAAAEKAAAVRRVALERQRLEANQREQNISDREARQAAKAANERIDKNKKSTRDTKFEKETGYRRAKGGIIEKPKPKKKTMKRGGLASKK